MPKPRCYTGPSVSGSHRSIPVGAALAARGERRSRGLLQRPWFVVGLIAAAALVLAGLAYHKAEDGTNEAEATAAATSALLALPFLDASARMARHELGSLPLGDTKAARSASRTAETAAISAIQTGEYFVKRLRSGELGWADTGAFAMADEVNATLLEMTLSSLAADQVLNTDSHVVFATVNGRPASWMPHLGDLVDVDTSEATEGCQFVLRSGEAVWEDPPAAVTDQPLFAASAPTFAGLLVGGYNMSGAPAWGDLRGLNHTAAGEGKWVTYSDGAPAWKDLPVLAQPPMSSAPDYPLGVPGDGDLIAWNATLAALQWLPDLDHAGPDQQVNTGSDVTFNSVTVGGYTLSGAPEWANASDDRQLIYRGGVASWEDQPVIPVVPSDQDLYAASDVEFASVTVGPYTISGAPGWADLQGVDHATGLDGRKLSYHTSGLRWEDPVVVPDVGAANFSSMPSNPMTPAEDQMIVFTTGEMFEYRALPAGAPQPLGVNDNPTFNSITLGDGFTLSAQPTPSEGQILVATGATTAEWKTPATAPAVEVSNEAEIVAALAAGKRSIMLGNDMNISTCIELPHKTVVQSTPGFRALVNILDSAECAFMPDYSEAPINLFGVDYDSVSVHISRLAFYSTSTTNVGKAIIGKDASVGSQSIYDFRIFDVVIELTGSQRASIFIPPPVAAHDGLVHIEYLRSAGGNGGITVDSHRSTVRGIDLSVEVGTALTMSQAHQSVVSGCGITAVDRCIEVLDSDDLTVESTRMISTGSTAGAAFYRGNNINSRNNAIQTPAERCSELDGASTNFLSQNDYVRDCKFGFYNGNLTVGSLVVTLMGRLGDFGGDEKLCRRSDPTRTGRQTEGLYSVGGSGFLVQPPQPI